MVYNLVDRELITYLINARNLIHLDVSSSYRITNKSIQTIAKHQPYLRTLNIQACNSLTDLSLAVIATHCGSRLEILYTNIREACCATELIVKNFSLNCTRITCLNIVCDFLLCSTTCASSLLTECPALRTLVINKEENISLTTRELSAIVKPELKILEHDASTVYDVLTLPV